MTLCPRPEKMSYPTFVKARTQMFRLRKEGKWLSAYRCVCGSYHLGHLRRTAPRWIVDAQRRSQAHKQAYLNHPRRAA